MSSAVSPLTNKSLNMLKTLYSTFRHGNMDKRSNEIVQNQECHTVKNHIMWMIERSALIKKQHHGEYVESSSFKNSSAIRKLMIYPSGRKEYCDLFVSFYIQFKNLKENTFIEGDVYILGKDGNTLLSKTFSGHASNLKDLCLDTFFSRDKLSSYLVNNTLNIHCRVNSISQTYNCVSDGSNCKVYNSPEIIKFRRLAPDIEKYSDVKVQTDSISTIKCHKFILASESHPFLILFKTFKRDIIDMHDKSTAIIEELVRFIYSGTILSLKFNRICQLYIAADEFGVLNLKDICSLILCSSLSSKNVPYLFELSVLYKDQYLIKACINFVKKNNIKSLVETFVDRSLKIKY